MHRIAFFTLLAIKREETMFRVYFSDDGDKTVCRTVVDVECMIRILTRYTDYATEPEGVYSFMESDDRQYFEFCL